MIGKILIAALVFLVLVGGGYYWNTHRTAEVTPTPPPPVTPVETMSTYSSTTLGFSVRYPKAYSVNDSYVFQFSPAKSVSGVKFTVPQSMATGTNLSNDSGVSIEWLPRATKCPADIYLLANVKSQDVTEGGIKYSVASSSDAGAGNRYEEIVYAFPDSKPCTAVRYFIHSTVLENYPKGTVEEFNRAALLKDFDGIRKSFKFIKQTMPASSSATSSASSSTQ